MSAAMEVSIEERRSTSGWSRRQESNLYLPLRRRPFYPLNYGEPRCSALRLRAGNYPLRPVGHAARDAGNPDAPFPKS